MTATDTVRDSIPEWRLQIEVCAGLDQMIGEGAPFAYAASLEGVRLTKSQAQLAKAQGMKAGEPDLRFYLPGGRVFFVELKAEGGKLNAAQKLRHPILQALGLVVHVVKATTPQEARAAVCGLVRAELAHAA